MKEPIATDDVEDIASTLSCKHRGKRRHTDDEEEETHIDPSTACSDIPTASEIDLLPDPDTPDILERRAIHWATYPAMIPSTLKVTRRDMDVYFRHTKFGCIGEPHITHIELSKTCTHACAYCYVNGYKDRLKSNEDTITKADPQYCVAVARAKFAQLSRICNGRVPEMHASISTDPLQARPHLQEVFYLLQEAWLLCGGLVSVVSKGVPYDPIFRAKLLSLWRAYPNTVSYQGTCASLDARKQALLETGAPPPMDRLDFLKDVVVAGVVRCSLRVNPLIPGHNDSIEDVERVITAAHERGVRRVAVSHMYASPKIFAEIQRRGVHVNREYFEQRRCCLSNGAAKQHVLAARRLSVLKYATEIGARLGVVVSTCGCDNVDIAPDSKCGICWNSGGKRMLPRVSSSPLKAVINAV